MQDLAEIVQFLCVLMILLVAGLLFIAGSLLLFHYAVAVVGYASSL